MNRIRLFLKRLLRIFRTGGLTDREFALVRPLLLRENYRSWRVISPLCGAYLTLLFLSSFSLQSISMNSAVYLGMSVVFWICTGLLCFKVRPDSKALMPVIYLLCFLLLAFGIIVGVICTPDSITVTYMVLMVALPLLVLDRPVVMDIVITCSMALFTIACCLLKTGQTRSADMVDCLSFWIIGLGMSCLVTPQRMHGWLSHYDVEADSYRDGLTRVKNQAAYLKLRQELEQKLEEHPEEPFALVMCDVNGLKHINDTYGHDKGDAYLVRNCQKLCQIFLHSPIYRVGGDEFLVYLDGHDYQNRVMLLSMAEAECLVSPLNVSVWDRPNFAIGMAEHQAGAEESLDELFHRADDLMYENKRRMHQEHREADLQHTRQLIGAEAQQSAASSRKKVLIIDDEPIGRGIAADSLQEAYDVLQADNGRKGLELLQEYQDVAVILLDLIMP